MLRVFLSRTDHLDGPADGFRDERGLDDEVRDDLASEAAAQKRHVNFYALGPDREGLRERDRAIVDALDRPPHFDAAARDVSRGIDGFHRRVRDVRNGIALLDDLAGPLQQDRSSVTFIDHGYPVGRIERCFEFSVGIRRRKRCGGTAVPRDLQNIGGALGLPEFVGDDRDEVRLLHHGMHARHRNDRRLVFHRHELAAETGRNHDGGVEHIGEHDVDSVRRRAAALRGDVDAVQGFPDQGELRPPLQARIGIERERCGCGDKRSVAELRLSSSIDDETVSRRAIRRRNVPMPRRRPHEGTARLRTGQTQAMLQQRRRHRRAFGLDCAVGVLRGVGRGEGNLVCFLPLDELHPDLGPVGVEFVGDQHRQHRVASLPDFRLRDANYDDPAGVDPNPIRNLELPSRAYDRTERNGDDERTSGDESGGEKDGARNAQPAHHVFILAAAA